MDNSQLTIGKNSQTGNSLPVIEHFAIRELLLIAYCLLSIDLRAYQNP
jgi:hypothetical protein